MADQNFESKVIEEAVPQANAGMDEFVSCLQQKNVTFYGAFWCPHCRAQKALFGDAAEALPYVECSTPDGNDQLETCKKEAISTYPTWKFADGEFHKGELTLAELSKKTGCLLPNEDK